MHPHISRKLYSKPVSALVASGELSDVVVQKAADIDRLLLILGIIGDLLWVVTYIISIYVGFRDHTYGLPLLAVCLNITWEFIFTFIVRPSTPIRFIFNLLWFVLDTFIVYQLFVFGAKEQRFPEFQMHFSLILGIVLIFAFIGHLTFYRFFGDKDGEIAAFTINLVMSVLFVLLLFDRRDLHGLSYWAGWTKLLGTGIISIANIIVIIVTKPKQFGFCIFLFISIFLFDVAYVFLLCYFRTMP